MSELIPININIADRTYRIKTLPADEEVIRSTVKLINDKIIEFKNLYAGKDMQDYLAMAVIWIATSLQAGNAPPTGFDQVSQGLQKLEAILQKAGV